MYFRERTLVFRHGVGGVRGRGRRVRETTGSGYVVREKLGGSGVWGWGRMQLPNGRGDRSGERRPDLYREWSAVFPLWVFSPGEGQREERAPRPAPSEEGLSYKTNFVKRETISGIFRNIFWSFSFGALLKDIS